MKRWMVTAEHADNRVPYKWKSLFKGYTQILQSHEGFDPGTLDLARKLEPIADATIIYPYTRLLVEINRSQKHTKLFSRFSKPLNKADKQALINEYYLPHWRAVENQIQNWLDMGFEVYHIGVHSFTPVLNRTPRTTDIGLLYDPSRKSEKAWADWWLPLLEMKALTVRRNYPYFGKSDGLITQMRKKFPTHYAGIELEINQKFVNKSGRFSNPVNTAIVESLQQLKHSGKG